MKVALVCTLPALACLVTVDKGFGLGTVKQEGKISALCKQSHGRLDIVFPSLKLPSLKTDEGKRYGLALSTASFL